MTAVAGGAESAASYPPLTLVRGLNPLPAPAGPVANVSGPTVSLSWGLVPGALFYDVFYYGGNLVCSVAAPGTGALSVGTSFTAMLDQDLSYYVAAVGAGGFGASSPAVSVRGGAAPPTSAPLLAATAGNGVVDLSWSPVVGATSYNIYRCAVYAGQEGPIPLYINTGVGSYNLCQVTYSDTCVQNGMTYYYQVKAVSLGGEAQEISNEASATPNQPPPTLAAPTCMYARAQATSIAIGWNAIPNATSYNIYRGQGGDAILYQVEVPASAGVNGSFTDSGLTPNTTYYYQVAAVNQATQGNLSSSSVSATPGVTPLHSPLAAASVAGGTGAAVYTSPNAQDVFGKAAGSDFFTSAQITRTGSVPPSAYGYVSLNIYRATSPHTAGEGTDVPVRMGAFYNTSQPAQYDEVSVLAENTTYYYRTALVTSDGEGQLSAEVSVKTGMPLLPAPLGLIVEPVSPDVAASSYVLDLYWGAVTDPSDATTGNTTAIAYNVYGDGFLIKNGVGAVELLNTLSTTGYAHCQVAAVSINGQGNLGNSAYVSLPAPPAGQPPGLAATAGNGSVTLNWILPPDPVGHPVLSYNIYRSTTSGGEGATPVITDVPAPNAELTNTSVAWYTDSGLLNGLTYYYRVAPVNDAGQGALSDEASAQPNDPPDLLPATARCKAVGSQGPPTLTWAAVPGADYYNIFRNGALYHTKVMPNTAPTGRSSPDPDTVQTLSWSDGSTQASTPYMYQIAPVWVLGQGSLSTSLIATPNSTAAAAPKALVSGVGDNWVNVSWYYKGDATGYDVYRSTKKGSEGAAMDVPIATGYVSPESGRLTFGDSNVTPNATYYYKIAMVDSGGEGLLSAGDIAATPNGEPLPPPVLVAVAGDTEVDLQWTQIPGAVTYNLWKLPAGERTWIHIEEYLEGTTYADTDVIPGIMYTYQVAAGNDVAEGALSVPARAMPGSSALPEPVAAASVTGPDYGAGPTVTVSWTPVLGAEGYHLYRDDVGPVGVTYDYYGQTQLTDTFYVVPGTTYTYSVAAFTPDGEGAISNTLIAMPNTHLGAGVALNRWYSGTNCNPGATATDQAYPTGGSGDVPSGVLTSLTTSVNGQAFPTDMLTNSQPGQFADTPYAPPHAFASPHFANDTPITTKADAFDSAGEEAVAGGFGKTYNKAYVLENPTFSAASDGNDIRNINSLLGADYGIRSSLNDLKGTILKALPYYTVFYINSHAGPGCFGDCLAGEQGGDPDGGVLWAYQDPSGGPSISAEIMRKYEEPWAPPPYSFIWINGCRSARDATLAQAFGIGTGSVDAAFLGYVEYERSWQPAPSWLWAFRQYLAAGNSVQDSVSKAYADDVIPRGSNQPSRGAPVVDAVAKVYGDPLTTLGNYVYIGTGGWCR